MGLYSVINTLITTVWDSYSIHVDEKVRDWSLITEEGGATKREGGRQVKFYPSKKGGRKKF